MVKMEEINTDYKNPIPDRGNTFHNAKTVI